MCDWKGGWVFVLLEHRSLHISDDYIIITSWNIELSLSAGVSRFKSGASHFEGRIEIYIDNQWISLCNDQWTQSNAHVICRQLGYKLWERVQFF